MPTLRLGTRGSLLAQRQSRLVAGQLRQHNSGLAVDWVIIQTSGDRITDRPLYDEGGKGLFIRELELALLDGRIDLAVHSYKDVPVTMPLVPPQRLTIAAVPPRAAPWDVLISRAAQSLDQLPPASRIGTGSLRRMCQLRAHFPHLLAVPIRGNIDTRLKKWAAGEFDALILAQAGLARAGLYDSAVMTPLAPQVMLPAAGQGALALQCRSEDVETRKIVAALNDPLTARCVEAERALVALLQGDCHSPIAALAQQVDGTLHLRAAVGAERGAAALLTAEARHANPQAVAQAVFENLCGQGVQMLLHPSPRTDNT